MIAADYGLDRRRYCSRTMAEGVGRGSGLPGRVDGERNGICAREPNKRRWAASILDGNEDMAIFEMNDRENVACVVENGKAAFVCCGLNSKLETEGRTRSVKHRGDVEKVRRLSRDASEKIDRGTWDERHCRKIQARISSPNLQDSCTPLDEAASTY